MTEIKHFYRSVGSGVEICYNVEISEPLTEGEMAALVRILADGYIKETVFFETQLNGKNRVVEIGRQLNFASPFDTNMRSIFNGVGIEKVKRIERSTRHVVTIGQEDPYFDRMTEAVYPEPLRSFDTGVVPEEVKYIPLKEKGPDALIMPGISMDEWDRNFYYDYFVNRHGRNPTDAEIFDLNNANSEHSRHGYFKGVQIIDGVKQEKTLFELVQATWEANSSNSVIAFHDNSSGIKGFRIRTIIPEKPGRASRFVHSDHVYHIIFTAETHNFPSGVAPFPGAETGTGGRIRDVQATGRGGFVVAGTAGYCVGSLNIPDHPLAWDTQEGGPDNLASPLQIEIGASNGASDYGNKFGEPVIQGFTRSIDMRTPDGQRWAFLKPIMFTGGIGQIDDNLVEKGKAQEGMYIVQIGGPAYRVGFGGGAASSMLQGDNKAELDFDAVQRGDAEMKQKVNRVIRACNEMGSNSPIVSIHDQGAGGPANVLKEIVEESGGRIGLRKINIGDPSMSVTEIWVAEYQERNGLLIHPSRYKEFEDICVREKVNCELLGQVTSDKRFVVHDELDGTTPVDLELDRVLGGMPQKTFGDESSDFSPEPLEVPDNLEFSDAIHNVFKHVDVGSKEFLTNKVDRSVTGLIAQQQCCGPLGLPVADVAVIAQSHFGKTGAATAIGEQARKMILNPARGAGMALGEALTNLCSVAITDLSDIKCSVNWMWAPKLPGEGAAIRQAAASLSEKMIAVGVACDGGKDSLSMATKYNGETVKSPRQLVISAYCGVPDIEKKVTPDIKRPGRSYLLHIDWAYGERRLGGSAFAHTLGQFGDKCPQMEKPMMFRFKMRAMQRLVKKGILLSMHDISDGGIITAMLEMAMAGNCGLNVSIESKASVFEELFSEELGFVVEVEPSRIDDVRRAFQGTGAKVQLIGSSLESDDVKVYFNSKVIINDDIDNLRSLWQDTSYHLERLQADSECVEEARNNCFIRLGMNYYCNFEISPPRRIGVNTRKKYPIAILREEGSNGDREMTSAFYQAGFDPWDVNMQDLLSGNISLEQFRGLVAVGGFSYADYPESAKGWAAVIRENENLWKQFEEFYHRTDTFSLGVCNGCQLFALLGWVPWRGISDELQPRFVQNDSKRFDHRWLAVKMAKSPAIMFGGMEDSVLGVPVAHGEGRLYFPDESILEEVSKQNLAPLFYVDDLRDITETYPFNPNGSPQGIAGLCSPDGRHLAIMPHPERAFLKWQWHYLPENLKKEWPASPWLKMFQNAFEWCRDNR